MTTCAIDRLSAANRAGVAAAGGLSLLRSAYGNGPLVRLRRASDDAEQDFSKGGGLFVSDIVIQAWGGGSNLFAAKVYDQSGLGRDFTQTTKANQLQYLGSGLSGLPTLDFNGTSQYLENSALAAAFSGTDLAITVHQVQKSDVFTSTRTMWAFGSDTSTQPLLLFQTAALTWAMTHRNTAGSTTKSGTSGNPLTEQTKIFCTRFDGANGTTTVNGNPIGGMNNIAFNVGAMAVNRFGWGARISGVATITNYMDGQSSEIIVFNRDIGAADAEVLSAYTRNKYSAPVLGVFSVTSRQLLPDVTGSTSGKGLGCTGLAYSWDGLNLVWGVHGPATNGQSAPWNPGIAITNLAGNSLVSFIDVKVGFPSCFSVQGVAPMPDGTYYAGMPTENLIGHVNPDGSDAGGSFSATGGNGATYDPKRNRLWVTRVNSLYRYDFAGNIELTFATGLTNVDNIWYDAALDLVWVLAGANGSAPTIRSYNPNTGAFGEVIFKFCDTLAGECVVFKGTDTWLMSSDEHFHTSAQDQNQLQTYTVSGGINRKPTPPDVDTDISVVPALKRLVVRPLVSPLSSPLTRQ